MLQFPEARALCKGLQGSEEPPVNATRVTHPPAKGCVYCMGAKLEINLAILSNETARLQIILGMDWMSYHYVILDYARTLVLFLEPGVVQYLIANKLGVSLREGTQEFMSLDNMEGKINVSIEDGVLVKEYPSVFPTEIPGLPLVRDVEFFIDLHPGLSKIDWKSGYH
ncbi:uncharacterized protein [Cicer arietinum]|uniref:Uncharacterized protein LOC101508804 n=1 Tax=Cicer arietinum TaxID=3827 RepID=A0A1S2XGX4_CICAR|nr:uncharacterized protein LOC101508804 [Cicer arietinum]